MGRGDGERAQLHLGYGASVWLCAAHRSPEFQTRRAGRDLVASLSAVWSAAGCLTASRSRALRAHLARVAAGGPSTAAPRQSRRRPGSYAWPHVRTEVARRVAGGEAPARVIEDVRAQLAREAARPPSVRAMRRWLSEGR